MANESKPGIVIHAPPNRRIHIRRILTDYTGTLSFCGKLHPDVLSRLSHLARDVEILSLTSDSFGTAASELAAAGLVPIILRDEEGPADEQKQRIAETFDRAGTAAFGNGRNDRLLLRCVRDAGGLAVAVDNGEGCAVETLLGAEAFAWRRTRTGSAPRPHARESNASNLSFTTERGSGEPLHILENEFLTV